MKLKKVLFVVDERQMGGVSILLEDILNKINISKYKISVLVLHNNGDYLNNLPNDVNVIYGNSFFDTVDLTIKDTLKTKNIKKIYSKVKLICLMKSGLIGKAIVRQRKKFLTEKYDVEIAFKDGFCAIFTAYGDSAKKYHWLHTDYSMYDCTANYKKLFDKIFPLFDKIIGVSNSVLNQFVKKYNVNNTDVIYNIIDEDKIITRAKEENIKYDKKTLNLISVGRIHNMKGYDRLVDIMNELNVNKKLNNVVLRIVGDGPDYELVKSKIDKYQLGDKVILLGRKRNPFPYVLASDCFLMCSRYEPFGLVILESMIVGTPVLSCNVASIKEIMDNKYGLIVDNSNEGLYNGILKIIEDRSILKIKKENLKKYHYNINPILKKIEDLLDE